MKYQFYDFPKLAKEVGLKKALSYDWNKSDSKIVGPGLALTGLFVIPLALGLKAPNPENIDEATERAWNNISKKKRSRAIQLPTQEFNSPYQGMAGLLPATAPRPYQSMHGESALPKPIEPRSLLRSLLP